MTAPTRRRTRAREVAMQLLFQVDLRGAEYLQEFGKTIEQLCAEESQDEGDVADFAVRLVTGTLEHRDAIDARLQGVTRNWDLRRMAGVDRNVLRMAIYELEHCADVPPKVTINEAIDLAKKYSTANSGGFCNGILDRIRIDLERERDAAKVAAASGVAAAPDQPAQPEQPEQQVQPDQPVQPAPANAPPTRAQPPREQQATGNDSPAMDSGAAEA